MRTDVLGLLPTVWTILRTPILKTKFNLGVALLDCLNLNLTQPRLVTTIVSRSGTENDGFFSTLDRRDCILHSATQLRMDSRAADSLFGGPDDGHDFFASLDGANTSPTQSVQDPAAQYPQSAPVDSYAAVPYSSASPASTAHANHSPDPYAHAANHAHAVSSQGPYAPPHPSHSATAYQPTRSIPSQPAATPYVPNITPGM